jgi:hypothetical protein
MCIYIWWEPSVCEFQQDFHTEENTVQVITVFQTEVVRSDDTGDAKLTLMNYELFLFQDQEIVSLGSDWRCSNVVDWEGQGWRRGDDKILTREQVLDCGTSRKVLSYHFS